MIPRVLLIGWDGAEPTLARRWMAEGHLPHLAALARDGFLATIRSTIRPESATAWATLLTGASPAQHGVFAFAAHRPGQYQTALNTTAGRHVRFIWEALAAASHRALVVNPPMAYPPRPFDGWLVCGQMTPPGADDFAHPPALAAELRRRGYVIDAEAPRASEERAAYLARMNAQVAARTEIMAELLARERWDFALLAHTEPDRIQHFYWADMDPAHPLHVWANPTAETARGILDHYRALDAALGALRAQVGPDALLIVVSDHGFGPCSRRVYMNRWLQALGLFTPREGRAARSAELRRLLGRAKAHPAARALKRALFGPAPLLAAVESSHFVASVDWRHTQAWFSDAGGIRINLAGREPQGCVAPGAPYERLRDALIQAALELRDPTSGLPVFRAAWRREDLYGAPPWIDEAPDLILETFHPPDGAAQNHIPLGGLGESPEVIFASSWPYTATHTDQALLAASRTPDQPIQDLADVARWVLAEFGLDADPAAGTAPTATALRDADDALLRRRLRALGYMD
jgi:predicted AlkP superfamily phosphohydrolase/phosphomutase